MKRAIASTLIAILLLAHAGQAYKNLCHGLVGSKFAELKRFELGNYLSEADGLALLPMENDACLSKQCLSHRLCYTKFDQFESHEEQLLSKVKASTTTITNLLDTLEGYYKKVSDTDRELTELRTNVRKSQISETDLKNAQKTAEIELARGQKELKILGTKINVRKQQWESRIDELSVKITQQDQIVQGLQSKSTADFKTIIADSKKFAGKYPGCFKQIQPFLMSIYQLQQYQQQLVKDKKVIEEFKIIVSKFKGFYMNIMTKTVGKAAAEKFDVKNINAFLLKIIHENAAQVQQIHARFKRMHGMPEPTRRMRFATSVTSFNFFVSGYTEVKELKINEAVAKEFYSHSAKIDGWIKEMYALQLALEMMVNSWSVKISTKLSMLEAMQGTNSKIRETVIKLKSDLSRSTTAQVTLTSEIKKATLRISSQDIEMRNQISILEKQLSKFSEKVTTVCGNTGTFGTYFVRRLSELQKDIELIEKQTTIKNDIFIQMSTFVTSSKSSSAWFADMTAFEGAFEKFLQDLRKFQQAAQQMWNSGAYDRNALAGLADSIENQKNALKDAWVKKNKIFEKLNTLDNALTASTAAANIPSSTNGLLRFKSLDKRFGGDNGYQAKATMNRELVK